MHRRDVVRILVAVAVAVPLLGLILLATGRPPAEPEARARSQGCPPPDPSPRPGDAAEAGCLWRAGLIEEPYGGLYAAAGADPFEGYPGAGPAFFSWDGRISPGDFALCDGQPSTVKFKILGGRLFVRRRGWGWEGLLAKPHLAIRHDAMVDMLLAALAVFAVPNVDFAVNFEDKNYCGYPALAYGPSPTCVRGGFAVPSWSTFADALGRSQTAEWQRCLDAAHPVRGRCARAVWRGTTTGRDLLTSSNFMGNARVRLALLGRLNRQKMDAGLTGYVQMNETGDKLVRLLEAYVPVVPPMEMEDFNNFELIIDLDGNAWSNRFSRLAFFNTPLLKQRSANSREYFGHLLANGSHVLFFEEDLSDFLEVLDGGLALCRGSPGLRREMVDRMQRFAAQNMGHIGVLRATAAVLTEVARKIDWKPAQEEGYDEIHPAEYRFVNPTFPPEFVRRVQMRGEEDVEAMEK